MTEARQVLFLAGSPKPQGSSSEILGSYLLEKLVGQEFSGAKIHLHQALRERENLKRMLESVNAAEVIVLTFPTYCDSLPAPVINALEEISNHRRTLDTEQKPRFLAIANCGFAPLTCSPVGPSGNDRIGSIYRFQLQPRYPQTVSILIVFFRAPLWPRTIFTICGRLCSGILLGPVATCGKKGIGTGAGDGCPGSGQDPQGNRTPRTPRSFRSVRSGLPDF